MPELVIDNREIEVPEGTKVIDAAEELGIMIPRFCYHPALGAVGACRVCAVKFVEGPFKGVQMSCMIDAKDDMVVSTTDEEAVEFRKYVIEWLMLNHPHDCPVCDEGGHCLLQDMTISGGHGMRRYLGPKRTYHDQYLGPLVQHEMNRCIHCYRCSRFYQEFTGYRDLGVMQSANRTYFGRHKDGILESPFTGNLSDICPTGVYTDKPSRFIGRRWDYVRSPSLCINCSLGCHTIASVRYREVVRQEARYSEAVNGHFICDRGRHGFYYASHPERPRQARLDGVDVPLEEAIRAAAERLKQISLKDSPGSIACVGSVRSSLETQAMLRRVCQMKEWGGPSYFMDQTIGAKIRTASSRLESEITVSLRDLERADFILVVGADPINEAPMAVLAMRQAQREASKIVVIDPRPISLPFDFQHLSVPLDEVNLTLGLLIKAAVKKETATNLGQPELEFYEAIPALNRVSPSLQEQILAVAQGLRGCQRPIIVCGTEVVRQTTLPLATDVALLLQAANKRAGLFHLMSGANAFGASLLADDNRSFVEILAAIEDDTIRGLILAESDPFRSFPDRQMLELAIEKLDLLVVLDYVNSQSAQRADVFLPTSTLYEGGGTFVNQEGRVQVAPRAYMGGIPTAQISGGDHPPRVYARDIPGGEPRPGWQALAEIANGDLHPGVETTTAALWAWLADANPVFANLPPIDKFPNDGVRLSPADGAGPRFSLDWSAEPGRERTDALELILVEWTFGTEELSSLSPPLAEVERKPSLCMHLDDAARLGLLAGDRVSLKLDTGSLEVDVSIKENMASGVVVLPRHRLLKWQKIKTLPKFVSFEDVKKIRV